MTILDEVEAIVRQEECEDNVYHVVCYHCGMEIDPHENPVYCWSLGSQANPEHIFVCEGCDAEHRTNYSIELTVKAALRR